jgi:hypothetical protein
MAKKTKRASSGRVLGFVIQSVLIVFSVLLALFLNEIREQQKIRADLKAGYRGIRNELETNRDALTKLLDTHTSSLQTIDSLLENPRANFAPEALFTLLRPLPNSVNPPILQNAAWHTLNATGLVTHLKFDEIYPLAKLYHLQTEDLENDWRELENLTEHFEKQQNTANLKTLQSMLHKLQQQEKHLLEEMGKALAALGNLQYLED